MPGEDVRLSEDDWSIVVAAGPGPNVADVLERLGLAEFAGCRRLAELVDRGLIVVRRAETREQGVDPTAQVLHVEPDVSESEEPLSDHPQTEAFAADSTEMDLPAAPPPDPFDNDAESEQLDMRSDRSESESPSGETEVRHSDAHEPDLPGSVPHGDGGAPGPDMDRPLSEQFPEPSTQPQDSPSAPPGPPGPEPLVAEDEWPEQFAHGVDSEAPAPAHAFPEHFPIDDLVEPEPGATWDQDPHGPTQRRRTRGARTPPDGRVLRSCLGRRALDPAVRG